MKVSLICLLCRFQRVFTPTIPARRVKKERKRSEDSSIKPNVDRKPFSGGRFSDGDREKQSRRERQREKREMIASASVFSLGPAERTAQRRKGGECRWIVALFCYACLPKWAYWHKVINGWVEFRVGLLSPKSFILVTLIFPCTNSKANDSACHVRSLCIRSSQSLWILTLWSIATLYEM